MIAIAIVLVVILVACAALFVFTRVNTRRIERRFPPIGEAVDVGGYRMHAVHLPAGESADLPPVVFIHGASGNLRDQMTVFRPLLEGRGELIFVDRPGHGYSERGPAQNALPDGQAAAIAALLDARGIAKAIVVGHSLGGVVAANFAVDFPEKTEGLVFLAPATHPWPGDIAWYNRLTNRRFIGPVFANLVAMPAGLSAIKPGMACVFAPNPMPADYIETAPALMLRPRTFRANATDLARLHGHIDRTAERYREIAAPTVIITGDSDGVVLPDLHSRGLYRDIEGSKLIWLKNVGHKPDYIATDLAVAAIETVAGQARDLHAIARGVENRVADDAAHGG